jgi:hypothetical protein
VARLRDGQLGDPRVHDIATTSSAANCGGVHLRPTFPSS